MTSDILTFITMDVSQDNDTYNIKENVRSGNAKTAACRCLRNWAMVTAYPRHGDADLQPFADYAENIVSHDLWGFKLWGVSPAMRHTAAYYDTYDIGISDIAVITVFTHPDDAAKKPEMALYAYETFDTPGMYLATDVDPAMSYRGGNEDLYRFPMIVEGIYYGRVDFVFCKG